MERDDKERLVVEEADEEDEKEKRKKIMKPGHS